MGLTIIPNQNRCRKLRSVLTENNIWQFLIRRSINSASRSINWIPWCPHAAINSHYTVLSLKNTSVTSGPDVTILSEIQVTFYLQLAIKFEQAVTFTNSLRATETKSAGKLWIKWKKTNFVITKPEYSLDKYYGEPALLIFSNVKIVFSATVVETM